VNHRLLAAGAAISILLIVLMYNTFITPDAGFAQPGSSAPTGPRGASSESRLLPLPSGSGMYACENPDYSDCAAFCGQVNLRPKRCMITFEGTTVGRSICACGSN
jgi:hypothetical protein